MTSGTCRVAAITGAGRGLGRAYAERLARSGAAVAVLDIDAAAAIETVSRIRLQGYQAAAYTVDVTQQSEILRALGTARDDLGHIDVLVNNAGGNVGPPAPTESITLDHWLRSIALNLTSAWLCMQAVIPEMKSRQYGRIINISTTIVSQGYPTGLSAYAAAKGGIVALTRTAARELGSHGITVNAVAPGLVPMDKVALNPSRSAEVQRHIDAVVGRQSIPRIGMPDDLTGMVEFLASADGGFITGQVFNVDGGWAMT